MDATAPHRRVVERAQALLVATLRLLLIAPAAAAALASAYMIAAFPPFQLIDEGGHLHAIAALAEGRLPHVGEPLRPAIMALAIGAPTDAPDLPPAPRYFLLHPPAYYALAAPWFALARGDWRLGLRLVRLFAGVALVGTAIVVPCFLVRAGLRRGSDRLDVYAGALLATLPLAMPGVLFASNFATNHLFDVVLGVLLGVSCVRVLSLDRDDGGESSRDGRWLFATALLAGLLAATRLTNVWALPIPIGLALLGPGDRRRRLAIVATGLLPAMLVIALWCADNYRASGELVPRHLADEVVRAEIGAQAAEMPPIRWLAIRRVLRTEILVGQGKLSRTADRYAGDALSIALIGWLAGAIAAAIVRRRRSGFTRESSRSGAMLPAALLAGYGFAANVLFLVATVLVSTVPRLVGRYLLTGTCFAMAIAGAAVALHAGSGRGAVAGVDVPTARGSSTRGRSPIAPTARAALALVLALLVIATWLPPQRLTPPHWGAPIGDRPPSVLERIFGRPE